MSRRMTEWIGSCYFSFKEVKKTVVKWESEALSCMILRTGNKSSCELWQKRDTGEGLDDFEVIFLSFECKKEMVTVVQHDV